MWFLFFIICVNFKLGYINVEIFIKLICLWEWVFYIGLYFNILINVSNEYVL